MSGKGGRINRRAGQDCTGRTSHSPGSLGWRLGQQLWGHTLCSLTSLPAPKVPFPLGPGLRGFPTHLYANDRLTHRERHFVPSIPGTAAPLPGARLARLTAGMGTRPHQPKQGTNPGKVPSAARSTARVCHEGSWIGTGKNPAAFIKFQGRSLGKQQAKKGSALLEDQIGVIFVFMWPLVSSSEPGWGTVYSQAGRQFLAAESW